MIILFIFGILLGAFAVVFALQNVAIVTVSFFSYEFTGSLSIILALALFIGVAITLLLILPETVMSYFKSRKLKKIIIKLEDELKKQKEKNHFDTIVPPKPEDIAKIEEGVIENKILN